MTGADPNTEHLRRAESRARRLWYSAILKRGRKAEGTFDGDSGKIAPSIGEAPLEFDDADNEVPDPTPRSPRFFTSREHVWDLVQRACRGAPVPVDIAEGFKTEYGKIHERCMLEAGRGAMKRENDQHVAAQREAKKAAKEAAASTTTARIAHKEELIKNLQRKVRLLETKIQKHRRSISALKRAAERKKAT